MKREFEIFLTALRFYTRIPVRRKIQSSEEYLSLSTRYFPVIGWIVAGIASLIYFLSSYLFSNEVSIVLMMLASILTTGAFHEDGLADVCDGFGGGWTKEKILTIMKDSRVGTYGVIGLVIALLLKFFLLLQLSTSEIVVFVLIIISAHSVSRASAATIIYSSAYAREGGEMSKAKPVATSISTGNLFLTSFFGLLPFLFLTTYDILFITLLVPVGCMTIYLRYYFKKWIGGYTGDCLGAVQQVNELVFYLGAAAILQFHFTV